MNYRTSKKFWQLMLLPVTAGMLLVLSSCGNSSAESNEKTDAGTEDVVDVAVVTLTPQAFAEDLKLTATVQSFNDVKVSAEAGGQLVKWTVPKGGAVREGMIIARLDSAMARATYDAANAQYKLAEVTYQKQKKVFEKQAISDLQMKTFEYQRDAAKAQADQAMAALEYTIVRSPINGVLNDRYVEVGEMVAPGVPVAHVVSTGHLKVTAGVPERYTGRMNKGDKVTFTSDAFPGEVFNGTISFVGAAIDASNRSIPVEITVTSGTGKLKPDMIATLRLTLEAVENAIVVKSDYLQQVDMNKHVAYVVENGVAREREVTIASTSNGDAYISKGLKAGDKFVTSGFQNVADGQKVNVK